MYDMLLPFVIFLLPYGFVVNSQETEEPSANISITQEETSSQPENISIDLEKTSIDLEETSMDLEETSINLEETSLKLEITPTNLQVAPTPVSVKPKIAGGFIVNDIRLFSYQVSLRYKMKLYTCGGSLISDTFVLTAAHCCTYMSDEYGLLIPINIVAGILVTDHPTEHTLTQKVLNVIVHEKYQTHEEQNDIAALQIEKIKFSDYVNKINIATVTPPDGTRCMVSGWGTTSTELVASKELRALEVPIESRPKCNASYQGDILEGIICAGYYHAGTKDACAGDSGGPLACKGVLAGIVSFGGPCEGDSMPGGYVDVAYYRKWIKNAQGIKVKNTNTNVKNGQNRELYEGITTANIIASIIYIFVF